MRALRILLRHRVTSWLRDPSWGTGTAAGQVVLLGLLLAFLFPLGLGSYVIGDVLRELYPDADALALINGGMLYLVPAFAASRFLFQSPPSEQAAPYAALPVPPTGLLNAQALLSLLSVHTVFAGVLVGPVWAAEVATAWALGPALAWLATALLLTVVLASHGATLLHLLLGWRPTWVLAGGVLLAGLFATDAVVGPDGLRAVSRFLFGRPVLGLAGATLLTAGAHVGLLRVMRRRLEVDRQTTRRMGGPSYWGVAVYQWIERTLPAGRLVALEVRQVVRTQRLRGVALFGTAAVLYFYGFALLSADGTVEAADLVNIALFGLSGPTFALGSWMFGAWAGYAEGLFARPHVLDDIAWAKLTVLWAGLLPGGLVLVGALPWLAPPHAALLGALLLCWGGVIVPGFVYLGPRARKPVDTSASLFTMNTSFHGLRFVPLFLFLLALCLVAVLTGAWWAVAAVVAVASAGMALGLAWTVRPLAQQLKRHRHDMLQGFRENDPI